MDIPDEVDVIGYKRCFMLWEADPTSYIVAHEPLIIELRRMDGMVILRHVFHMDTLGGHLAGIGVR